MHLKYGQKVSVSDSLTTLQIALKSILNDNYVKVDHQECTATARGHHPILYVSFSQLLLQFQDFWRVY